MATLKKRRGKWYSRVRKYDEYGKRVERQIPLRTDNKTVAHKRNRIVTKYQNDVNDMTTMSKAQNETIFSTF